MRMNINIFLTTVLSLLPVVINAQTGVSGACTCEVETCENDLDNQGCLGTVSVPVGDFAAFCSIGVDGSQDIYYTFDDYAHQNRPDFTCSNQGSTYHLCTCSQYSGTDYGNLNVTNYPTNSAGYVTDSSYYGTATPPDGACYCDIYSQYSPDGSTLQPLGYYSLGTASEPAMCQFNNVQGPPGSSTSCEVVTQEGGGYGPIQTMCKCATSNATPFSGSVVNSTSPQIVSAPDQSLINNVLNAANAQKSSGSSSTSTSSSQSSGTRRESVTRLSLCICVSACATFFVGLL